MTFRTYQHYQWSAVYTLDHRTWTWSPLGSVTAPVLMPGNVEWPWTPPPYRIEQTTAWRQTHMLGQDKLPFRTQVDLPRGPFRPEFTWALNLAIRAPVSLPFSQYDWPLSQRVNWYREWAYNFVLTVPIAQVPFSQYDWPLPQRPPRLEQTWGWRQVGMLGQDVLLAGEQSYDLTPRAAPRLPLYSWEWRQVGYLGQDRLPVGEQVYDLWVKAPKPIDPTWTWRQVGMLGQDTLPENQYDWPLPRANYRIEQTWVWRQVGMLGRDTLPENQYDWPLPGRPPRLDQTWTLNLQQTTLRPAVAVPFNQFDWPLPKTARPIEQTWAWRQVGMLGQDRLPVGEQVTDLWGRPPHRIDQTYSQNLILFGTQPPGEQSYQLWTAAARRPIDLYTWIQSVNVALTVAAGQRPFNQYDWPLPRAPKQPALGWTWRQLHMLGKDRLPNRQQDWPLPNRGPAQFIRSWSWRQVGMLGQDKLPFNQYYWPLVPDALRSIQLRTWTHRTHYDTVSGNIIEACDARDIVSHSMETPNVERPWIRDWFDRDEWGHFYPGSGIRRG